MKYLMLFCLFSSLVFSCTDNKQIGPESISKVSAKTESLDSDHPDNSSGESDRRTDSGKTYNGIHYTVNLLNAVDFVARKGEKPDLKERLELSKESVAILKIDLRNQKETSVFESTKMTMNKEDALKYLIGQVATDFTIEQDGKSIAPTGVQYDSGVSEPDNIKLFFFFNQVNLNQPVSVLYYDRMFGSGLMRFNINNGK